MSAVQARFGAVRVELPAQDVVRDGVAVPAVGRPGPGPAPGPRTEPLGPHDPGRRVLAASHALLAKGRKTRGEP